MTPTKQTRIREPRIKTLQIRVSPQEYQNLESRYHAVIYRIDDGSIGPRSFTDWLRQTLLKQTK